MELEEKPLVQFGGKFDWVFPYQTQVRLDQFLSGLSRMVSRAFWVRAVEGGMIWINGEPARRKNQILKKEDRIRFDYFQICRDLMGVELHQDVSYRLIEEDENFVVVEKPSGVLIHRIGFLDFSLVSQVGRDLNQELFVIHRLDKYTSGIVVFGKHAEAAKRFQSLLHSPRMAKIYLAASFHPIQPVSGLMLEPIGQDDVRIHSKKQKVDFTDGSDCKTRYRMAGEMDGRYFYLVRIFTGRQHQIRVHFQNRGAPLIQDELYAYQDYDLLPAGYDYDESWLGLHAYRLRFEDPFTGKYRVFTSRPSRWPFERLFS